MKIIALDLGSHMAMAHNGMDVPVVEYWEEKGIRAHRLASTMRHLAVRFKQIKAACHIDLVIYERPFARGYDATRAMWGIAGVIEAMATHNGWPVCDATPQSIKKFAIGGRARTKMSRSERTRANEEEKEMMIAAARAFGYVVTNEHEADAACLLEYAKKHATVTPVKPIVKRRIK